MNQSHISDADQSSLSCSLLWFHPLADDWVILVLFKESAPKCGWLLSQFARGKSEACVSEAATTLWNQRAAGPSSSACYPGVRDVGSSRACISRALARISPEPVAVSAPPSPSPVRHSQFLQVMGQIWPKQEGQVRARPPFHMRSHE